MPRRLHEIQVGDWLTTAQRDERFEIVAMDTAERTIEIQYDDGTVEEIDFEHWPELAAEETSPPDDWVGALDAERDDREQEPDPKILLDDPYEDSDELLY